MSAIWCLGLLTAALAPSERFDVKSGTVEFVWHDAGPVPANARPTEVLYFDDYGEKRAEVIRQPATDESWKVRADGWETRYSLSGTRRIAKKKRIGDRGLSWVSTIHPTLSEKQLAEDKKRTSRDLPPKEIAGRTCKGVEYRQDGFRVQEWTWKGLILEQLQETLIADGGGRTSTGVRTAIRVDLETAIPPERFKPPTDVQWVTADW
ncbi:MAG: hypothetical protein ACXWLM_12160 [Myxococcales bacterium]